MTSSGLGPLGSFTSFHFSFCAAMLKTGHAMGRLRAYCESHNLAAAAKFGCFVLGIYISVSMRL